MTTFTVTHATILDNGAVQLSTTLGNVMVVIHKDQLIGTSMKLLTDKQDEEFETHIEVHEGIVSQTIPMVIIATKVIIYDVASTHNQM